jgi:putative transposase
MGLEPSWLRALRKSPVPSGLAYFPQMRKNIATRKMFPHDDAVIKILFLNIRNLSNRWSRRQGWDIVINQLAVMFGERLKPEIVDGL